MHHQRSYGINVKLTDLNKKTKSLQIADVPQTNGDAWP